MSADRGPYGRGIAATYDWPGTVREVPVDQLHTCDLDVAILQRPEELALVRRLVRRPVPLIYLEHNTPKGAVPATQHPMADRDDLTLVHVTHFNALFWDSGATRTVVVEHGIPEPEVRYSGELDRLAAAINEPVRRSRVTGTDLLAGFTPVAPLDLFGMGVRDLQVIGVQPYEDLPQRRMHQLLARRRAYVHPMRWTSLGLSLLEAMSIGMPVLVLATTEAVEAVPPGSGVLSTRPDVLVEAAQWLIDDPHAAYRMGEQARLVARARYGLDRFQADWDRLLSEVTA